MLRASRYRSAQGGPVGEVKIQKELKMKLGTRGVRWFSEIGMDDVPLVGGKNASLGEMTRELGSLAHPIGSVSSSIAAPAHCPVLIMRG